MTFSNATRGQTYGFELATSYKVTPAWQTRVAYSFLVLDFQPVPGSNQPETWEGESPRNQVYLQSSFDLGRHSKWT